MDVTERLVARRARLAPFCQVEPVKQHLRLQSYYQLARQLYRQSETYFAERDFDNAYVFLAKFIKLCSKVVTAHGDYELPKYKKERDWVRQQAADGFKLFDAILDGMEAEELEYLEYERSLSNIDSIVSAGDREAASPGPMTLEDRLRELRLAKSEGAQRKSAGVAGAQLDTKPASVTGASGVFEAQSLRDVPPPTAGHAHSCPPLPARERAASESVSYPKVGKASWMNANTDARNRAYLPPPISRQRSQEAIANLTSGKIRTVEIPSGIISQFTQLAAPNTNRPPYGIETCGILGGILHDRTLIITTLIIPKQEGSSDMCSMTNEEELYDFCFSNELLTLGWIHTHPKQDCFLSSVDIHTQCGFQSILPEAVAIVVAPRDKERNVGVFRLTEPDGLQLIQNCSLSGFHTHPTQIQIYSDAMECKWRPDITAQLVDMR